MTSANINWSKELMNPSNVKFESDPKINIPG
jgi:hypothetical protein